KEATDNTQFKGSEMYFTLSLHVVWGAYASAIEWIDQTRVALASGFSFIYCAPLAFNVPEELQNYQSICETGSMIGAVEEVDLMSLDYEDIMKL
ncbi:hypothetical protein ACJX0J_015031, partial [Zea mays]